MDVSTRVRFPLALAVALSLAGCESVQPFYDGPARGRSEVALIPVYSDVKIDQRRGDVIRKHIAVLPGRHTAEVFWRRGSSCKMEFSTAAGAAYAVSTSSRLERDAQTPERVDRWVMTAKMLEIGGGTVGECSDALFVPRGM